MKKLLLVLVAVALLLAACTININTRGTTEAESGKSVVTEEPTKVDPVEETQPATEAPEDYEEKVTAELDPLWEKLNSGNSGTRYTHSWSDGDLFIYITCPLFEQYLGQMDGYSAEDRATIIDSAHQFVSGSIGSSIYDIARSAGGESFDVYITLGCIGGICCSSKNLEIFIDRISE